ncbi:MAG TPA: amidohydrolase family protein [Candidatus Paceibacterota bacterium]
MLKKDAPEYVTPQLSEDTIEEDIMGNAFHQERLVSRDTGTAAFTPIACREPKAHNQAYYSGKLIDSHFHMPFTEYRVFDAVNKEFVADEGGDSDLITTLGVNVTIPEITCLLDYEGTDKVFAFIGIATDYTEERMGVSRKKIQVEVVKKIINLYLDYFVPFIGMPDEPRGFQTAGAEELKDAVSLEPGLFRGYGEVALYPSEGVPSLSPDSERLREIYPVAREHGLVVYFHLDEGQKDSFRKVLGDNPDITFVFHGDQLIDHTFGYDLSGIEEILENHPNAFYTVDQLYGDVWLLRPKVTKEKFLAHFKDYDFLIEQDLRLWKDLIESHPDQVMWGTDRGGLAWSVDYEVGWTLADYSRAFIARLDPAAQEKFAYQNAERIMRPLGRQ